MKLLKLLSESSVKITVSDRLLQGLLITGWKGKTFVMTPPEGHCLLTGAAEAVPVIRAEAERCTVMNNCGTRPFRINVPMKV